MTTQTFFDKWDGQGLDRDGYPKENIYQCKDVANAYATDVVGKPLPAGNAIDMTGITIDGYQWIPSPVIVELGDIVVWGSQVGTNGHIAVGVSGSASAFTSFDQNWPLGSLCHYQNHNYNGVVGVQRPRSQGGEMLDRDHVNAAFRAFRGRPATEEELATYTQVSAAQLIETLDQGAERDAVASALATGETAVKDRWDQQIYSLEDQVKTLTSQVDTLQKAAQAAQNAQNPPSAVPGGLDAFSVGQLLSAALRKLLNLK